MRKFGVYFLIFIFAFSFASAVDFQMNENFSQGETLLAKVSGNFLQKPLQQNIFLYRNKVRVALDYHLVQVDNDFYLYAQLLGKESGNYSVVIKNVRYYTTLQKVSEEDLAKNLTITDDIATFSLTPGFVETQDNFSLTFKNLLDKEIIVFADLGEKKTSYVQTIENSSSNSTGFWESLFGGDSSDGSNVEAVEVPKMTEFTLGLTEIKTLEFSLTPVAEEKFQNVIFSSSETSYSLPIHLLASEIKAPENNSLVEGNLFFEPSTLNISISSSDNVQIFVIKLINNGDAKFENISLSFDNELQEFFSISSEFISEIKDDETVRLNLSTNSMDYAPTLGDSFSKSFEGNLIAKSENKTEANLKINFNIFKGNVPDNILPRCLELGGNICTSNSTCDAQIKQTQEGSCCIGSCIQDETPKISLALLGWILVILVIIFLVWFFKFRYKGVRSDPNLNKYLQKR